VVTCPPERYPEVVLDLGMKKGGIMVKKGYTPEQIINKLREAEILLSQGSSIVEASRKIGVRIYVRELKRISRKFTHMRYHSFLMYFGVLKRLGWVETTEETQPSAIQDNYPQAPSRTYYRLTKLGIEAVEELWSNPLFTLYPEIGPSHMK
jgi:hypothetical protein